MSELSKRPPNLPANVEEMNSRRTAMRQRTLNDYVDDIHVALYPDANYRAALYAVRDKDAIEGSVSADNYVAATMIREYATTHNVPQVPSEKLAMIVRSLNVVLRRCHISRQERRNAIRIGLVSDQKAAAE